MPFDRRRNFNAFVQLWFAVRDRTDKRPLTAIGFGNGNNDCTRAVL